VVRIQVRQHFLAVRWDIVIGEDVDNPVVINGVQPLDVRDAAPDEKGTIRVVMPEGENSTRYPHVFLLPTTGCTTRAFPST
jgi:hypothetical protein